MQNSITQGQIQKPVQQVQPVYQGMTSPQVTAPLPQIPAANPNYAGVNIQIFNPMVGTPAGCVYPTQTASAYDQGTQGGCYPPGYYTTGQYPQGTFVPQNPYGQPGALPPGGYYDQNGVYYPAQPVPGSQSGAGTQTGAGVQQGTGTQAGTTVNGSDNGNSGQSGQVGTGETTSAAAGDNKTGGETTDSTSSGNTAVDGHDGKDGENGKNSQEVDSTNSADSKNNKDGQQADSTNSADSKNNKDGQQVDSTNSADSKNNKDGQQVDSTNGADNKNDKDGQQVDSTNSADGKNGKDGQQADSTNGAGSEKNKKTEKRKVVELSDDYIKTLENYLNSQDSQVRQMGAKEVVNRLMEDDSRKDDPALTALVNKMLQDPSSGIRAVALSLLESRTVLGNDYTVNVLKKMQNSKDGFGQDSVQATSALLKMAGKTVEKEFEVKDSPKQDKK